MSKKISITKKDLQKGGIELTKKQHELYKAIRNNTITIVQGPAGTAKTFTACYTALALLADKKIDNIILTKPIKESGEELGHLPGDISEKTEPFMESYFTNFTKILGNETIGNLRRIDDIQVRPFAYMRGATYDNSIILLDEAQNATIKQIMLWITRLGKNSKAVMMGDLSQYDINKKDSRMLEFIDMVEGVDSVANFKFDSVDIMRNKVLIEIVDRYEKRKAENKF